MAIQFVTDRFHWDTAGRRFLLVEPLPLFDEPPDRVTVQAWRIREGWQLLYTHRFEDASDMGVIDLWTSVEGLIS